MTLPVALQLYSVRDDFQKDMPGTLRAVKEMGYQGVEFAGLFGHSASEIRAMLEGESFTPPTLEERIETALAQMAHMIEEKGERVGFAESKKQMAWYIHGVSGAADARGRLMTATTPDEVAGVMRGLIR